MLGTLTVGAESGKPPGEPKTLQEHAEATSRLLVPKEGLDHAGRQIGRAADSLADSTNQSWLEKRVVFGIPAARALTTLILLVIMAGAAFILQRWVNRRAGQLKDRAAQSWPRVLISAASKPLLAILFLFGSYLALVPSLRGIGSMPDRLAASDFLSWLVDIGALAGWFWLTMRLVAAVEKRLDEQFANSRGSWSRLAIEIGTQIVRVSVPLLMIILVVPVLKLPQSIQIFVQKGLGIGLIAGAAGLIIRSVLIFQRAVMARYRLDAEDNLEARKVYTQVSVLAKIIISVVAIIAIGSMLMVFDVVRQLGASLLASAGIAGIILGFAAQKILGNLFAGIQIAITQPIRHDDVVIVENEFGRIEDITLTYVVVKVWDLRRIVLPITYFVEKPFQNWTRTGSKLLGAVMLYTDYRVSFEDLRAELCRVVEASPLWDGDVCGMQVTDAKDNVIEIRCLASARNASSLWDLRCEIREKLIAFIQRNAPDSLPRVRLEVLPREAAGSLLRAEQSPPA